MASLQLVKGKHVSESCVGSAWPCSHSSAAGMSSQLNFFSCTCGFEVRIQELAISHETLRHHKRMKHALYIDFSHES